MTTEAKQRTIKDLLEKYLTASEERDRCQWLLNEAEQHLKQAQNRLYRENSREDSLEVLEYLQEAIKNEGDPGRRKKLVLLAMVIKSRLEDGPGVEAG